MVQYQEGCARNPSDMAILLVQSDQFLLCITWIFLTKSKMYFLTISKIYPSTMSKSYLSTISKIYFLTIFKTRLLTIRKPISQLYSNYIYKFFLNYTQTLWILSSWKFIRKTKLSFNPAPPNPQTQNLLKLFRNIQDEIWEYQIKIGSVVQNISLPTKDVIHFYSQRGKLDSLQLQ